MAAKLKRAAKMDRSNRTKKRVLQLSPTSSKLERRGSLQKAALQNPTKCLLGDVPGFGTIFFGINNQVIHF